MTLIDDSISIKQVILEKLRFNLRKAIPNHYPTEVDYIQRQDFDRDMYLELRQYIWAEKLQETTQNVRFEFAYPSSWWQYFKQDYFPQWLLNKFPVDEIGVIRDKKVTFKRFAAFPRFRYATEKGCEKFVIHEYILEKNDPFYLNEDKSKWA